MYVAYKFALSNDTADELFATARCRQVLLLVEVNVERLRTGNRSQ